MRYAILLVLMLFLSSCSYKSDGYYLLNGAKSVAHKATYSGTLGVAKIELPDYLKGDRLAVKLTPNHIVYRDEKWIEGFGEMLRDRLIKFLKNSLNNQKIYKYPWKVDRVPQKVLKITIDEFVYDKSRGKVVLESSWSLGTKSFHFHKELSSGSGSDEIVEKMSRLFGEFEGEVVGSLGDK